MAITRLNSLAIPAGTIVESDLSYPLTNFSSTGIDDNADALAITIDASENVGIGTTSPSYKLHVSQSSSGALVNSFADDLFVEASSHAGITVGSGATSTGNLAFTDSGNNFVGYVQYNHGDDSMRLGTNASERMRIGSSGSVGIGTSSPNTNAKFEVVSTNAGAVTNVIQLRNGDATAGSGAKLQFLNSTVNYATAGTSEITGVRYSGNYSALTFTTYGPTSLVERMRIDGVGNVGIGTASPSFISSSYGGLHVNSSTSGASIKLTNPTSGSTGSDGFDINLDSSSIVTYINREAGGIQRWYTGGSERMRLDSSGNLLVGTSSLLHGSETVAVNIDSSIAISTERNDDFYALWFIRSGVNRGSVYVTSTSTTYNTTSDQRLKENIVDAPAGNIDAVRVRSFDWKADGSHQTYGMVAQELVEVAPEAVSQGETEDDMWGVDYSKLVPMMIKEIQDLKAEVAALKGA